MLVSCAWIFRIFERAGIWYWRDKRKVHNPNISFQCLKLSWLFIENSKIGSWRPEAVRGGPTLPRLVSDTWNFLNCETFKCGSCTRVRPTLAHEPFITHAPWPASCKGRTKADGMYSFAFVKPNPAPTARAAQKADCIRGRVCEQADYSYAGSGWGKAKQALQSVLHMEAPASSLHIAKAHIYFSLLEDFATVLRGIFIGVRASLLRLRCFLPFELVLAGE